MLQLFGETFHRFVIVFCKPPGKNVLHYFCQVQFQDLEKTSSLLFFEGLGLCFGMRFRCIEDCFWVSIHIAMELNTFQRLRRDINQPLFLRLTFGCFLAVSKQQTVGMNSSDIHSVSTGRVSTTIWHVKVKTSEHLFLQMQGLRKSKIF